MTPKNVTLLAGAASLLLAACSDNGALPTDPSARASAGPRAEVSAAGVSGPLLSAVAANVCADVIGASRSAGARLIGWSCHNGANQSFTLQSSGAITAYDGALCLDVAGGQAKDGDPVVTWTCHGGANQKWTRTAAGELRTAVNGKCLDLAGARVGEPIIVWTCHGGANQKWTVSDAGASADPVAMDTTNLGGSAELPRASVDTRMPAVTGRSIAVPAGADLQAALNAAMPGDEVVLAPGATFVGAFELRPKPGMGPGQWITVRSGGALPPEGTRVGPGNAPQMAKLLTPNNWAPALATTPGAQGWRITGLEISSVSGTTWNYSFVNLGTAGTEQNSAAQIPSRIVLDRVYVHAHGTFDLRRCVALNSASSAVVDSYLADCHSKMNDSQAILGWNGPGPYKIVNNYLEGGHEVVMFGGNDPTVPGVVPSDIEFRRNHVTRPTSWRGVWQVKNLLELKAGQRLLIEGNVFENNWLDAQNGFAFVWMSNNQEGGCTWCVVQDVTFRYNRVRNVQQAFNLSEYGSGNNGAVNPAVPTRRVTIAHNVVTGADAYGGRMLQIIGGVSGVTFINNSGFAGNSDVYFTTPNTPVPTLVYRNNVGGSTYGIFADGGYMGNHALGKLGIPAGNVTGNVLATSSGSFAVPSGNSFATSVDAIGLVDRWGGDLTLSPSSSFVAAGTGGGRPGANVAAINTMVAGVVR